MMSVSTATMALNTSIRQPMMSRKTLSASRKSTGESMSSCTVARIICGTFWSLRKLFIPSTTARMMKMAPTRTIDSLTSPGRSRSGWMSR